MPLSSAGSSAMSPNQSAVGRPLKAATVYALSRAMPMLSRAAPSGRRNAISWPAASQTEMFTGTPRVRLRS